MHVLPRMSVMLDFICMGQVELPEARNKLKYKMKNCPLWDWNLRHARQPQITSLNVEGAKREREIDSF